MKYSPKMNQELGTKWFTFYTRVRPWLSCVFSLTLIVDFMQYTDTYLNYWWMLLYFLAGIAQPILCLIVFFRSEDDYVDLVNFIKKVLLFETIDLAYSQGVQKYVKSNLNFGAALLTFLVILLLAYLLWYRLNVKYFMKRIRSTTGDGTGYITVPQQDNAITQNDTASENSEIRFCRNCGQKLVDGSLFCQRCGTRIVKG